MSVPEKEKTVGERQEERRQNMRIGNREFDTEHDIYLMGILNVTPDSFSDGGNYNSLEKAMEHAARMIEEGVDIIDVGGESTRPGYERISDQEEIERVVPVIKALKERFQVPVSVDTYKSKVAKAGIEAGADLINDIWGLKADPMMGEVIAKAKLPCVLMHNRDHSENKTGDLLLDMKADLEETLMLAKKAGISEDAIILDPGVGFGKTYEQNLESIARLRELREMGYPVLLGTSRKSVIGLTIDVPAKERDVATAVTSLYGLWSGCSFVRVHNVKANREAIAMAKAIDAYEKNA